MQLCEIMTGDIETISLNASVQEAARKMSLLDVGMLPVIDGDKLLGAITDRDITVRAVAQNLDPTRTPVRRVMTDVVVSGFSEQDLKDGAHLMMENQIRRLPILNRDKKLVGIVSLADLVIGLDDKSLAAQVLESVSEPAKVLAHV